ncbi:MAG: ROK family protein [Verrucomicrobiales bacterium]|nr:ROK family protein [Verrucomicrobiales bacterium]
MTNPKAIGIDFGGTSVKLAVVEGSELLTDVHRIPTQNFVGPDPLIAAITEAVGTLKETHPDVVGIGVGVPGAVDYSKGVTYNLTNVKGWSDVPLRDKLAETTGMPTVLDNDANCMAFAEWKFGAGQGYHNVLCVTLGTGVGGGLILNDQLYRGSTYAAGEIGQMSIDLDGVDGPYGNSGALERYIGNRQIGEMAARMYEEKGIAIPEDHSPEGLARLAREGDEVARAAWSKVAYYLGSNLMSTIYLLNPDAIVIGGGVSYAGELLFDPLKRRLKETLTQECFGHLSVVNARFGNTAGIIGCSAMAAELV